MAEASAKRVICDEPQGTMERVQTAGEALALVSFPPSFARTSRETSGYEAATLHYTLSKAAFQSVFNFPHPLPPSTGGADGS